MSHSFNHWAPHHQPHSLFTWLGLHLLGVNLGLNFLILVLLTVIFCYLGGPGCSWWKIVKNSEKWLTFLWRIGWEILRLAFFTMPLLPGSWQCEELLGGIYTSIIVHTCTINMVDFSNNSQRGRICMILITDFIGLDYLKVLGAYVEHLLNLQNISCTSIGTHL